MSTNPGVKMSATDFAIQVSATARLHTQRNRVQIVCWNPQCRFFVKAPTLLQYQKYDRMNFPCGFSVDKTTRSLSHTSPKKRPGTLYRSRRYCFKKIDGLSIRASILCSSHTLSASRNSLSGRAASCEDFELLYHPSRNSQFSYNYMRHMLKLSVIQWPASYIVTWNKSGD